MHCNHLAGVNLLSSIVPSSCYVVLCWAGLQVAVSFAHIVKSAEPVFSVILSGPILGTSYPW
jgi:hypothetical protein